MILNVKNGTIGFKQIDNTSENIKESKKECSGAIITTRATFMGLGLGKVSPVKALLTGKLKVKGLKTIMKFTKYFSLLR